MKRNAPYVAVPVGHCVRKCRRRAIRVRGLDCGQANTCPTLPNVLGDYGGSGPTVATGTPLGTVCSGPRPTSGATPKPQVTPGLVLTALRRLGLPSLEARTQPEDKTLVNFATIFYATPQPFTRTITLLGQSVDVEATPSSYTWHYGDGTSTTTSTPERRTRPRTSPTATPTPTPPCRPAST